MTHEAVPGPSLITVAIPTYRRESVLLDTMYDLPSLENVYKVVVDEAVINGESRPLLIYEGKDMQKVAPD